MLKLLVGALCVLGAVGCEETEPIGPDPDGTSTSSGNSMGGAPPGGGFESGERLKARTLVGADGSRSPAGWYDSELDVECAFVATADGSQRCLPLGGKATHYRDANCTQPLVPAACGVVPEYFLETSECGAVSKVLRVGADFHEIVYAFTTSGSCVEDVAPSFNIYEVTEESVPLSSFVGASFEIED